MILNLSEFSYIEVIRPLASQGYQIHLKLTKHITFPLQPQLTRRAQHSPHIITSTMAKKGSYILFPIHTYGRTDEMKGTNWKSRANWATAQLSPAQSQCASSRWP